MSLIVKEENFTDIVMSEDFVALDKPLMVEIIRKRVYPGRGYDTRVSKLSGIADIFHIFSRRLEIGLKVNCSYKKNQTNRNQILSKRALPSSQAQL